jgi:hypothetical protein
MKKCAYCNEPVINKQKSAKFCSVLCRIKAYRERNGIVDPFDKKEVKKGLKMDVSNSKDFTCCVGAKFYSPALRWGEVLICENCGARWVRE